MRERIHETTAWLFDIELGTGAWAWGDRFFWQYGNTHSGRDVQEAFWASIDAGVNFFDTAEIYGLGRSERMLGQFMSATDAPVLATSKFMPLPWRLTRKSLMAALQGSLERLGLEQIDLYLVHQPFPPVSVETWAHALADAVEAGLARTVGVSNYNRERMMRAFEVLEARGVPLAANQVEYSLLNRLPERNGVKAACDELGVRLIAYSPLSMGLLTGKYTPKRTPPGVRQLRYNRKRLEQIQPLLATLKKLGEAHGGKTPAQVSLNWLICKGTLPIPGAKNAHHATQNAGALGWRLTPDEVAQLDEVSHQLG